MENWYQLIILQNRNVKIKPMPGNNRSKVGIDVVEKIISLKEVDQEFLTNKTILAYLGGVSKEYIKDLREYGVLPYYKVRNTIFYKVSDVRKMVEKNRIIC